MDKLKARDVNATSLSSYDDFTLYTTLPHNVMKDKLIEVVFLPFLDGDVPRSASCGFCASQLIRFARASSCVAGFSTRGELLTKRLLGQGCWCHKFCITFSRFYRRYYGLISKFEVGLGSLLRQGLSGPDFYGGLVYGSCIGDFQGLISMVDWCVG